MSEPEIKFEYKNLPDNNWIDEDGDYEITIVGSKIETKDDGKMQWVLTCRTDEGSAVTDRIMLSSPENPTNTQWKVEQVLKALGMLKDRAPGTQVTLKPSLVLEQKAKVKVRMSEYTVQIKKDDKIVDEVRSSPKVKRWMPLEDLQY